MRSRPAIVALALSCAACGLEWTAKRETSDAGTQEPESDAQTDAAADAGASSADADAGPAHDAGDPPDADEALADGGLASDDGAVIVPVLGPSSQVALGAAHACALGRDGQVACWGGNGNGAVGAPTPAPVLSPRIVDGVRALQLAAGGETTCALVDGGTVQCWGDNHYGQLGDGSSVASSSTPVTVAGLSDALSVAVGTSHACAIRRSGALVCWGRNDGGQLGTGDLTDARTPRPVTGLGGAIVTALAAGAGHTCAVVADGSSWCWGHNELGQLGRAHTDPGPSPERVQSIGGAGAPLGTVSAIAAGSGSSCQVRTSGELWCWGDNTLGALGSEGASTVAPRRYAGPVSALQVALGTFGCAGLEAGEVTCWGDNRSGQLGDGTRQNRALPARVASLPAVSQVAVGDRHACAVAAGDVHCWGANDLGQLGLGDARDRPSATALPQRP